MADLITHYKERSPQETVELIKKFFNDNGYTLKQTESRQSEAGTWYCHVDVYKDDVLFRGAHGKGMTEEYALASGYAELYERFCNKIFYLANPCWAKTLIEKNKANNGYYFSPKEHILTYDELISYKATNNYFNELSDNDPELTKALVDFITEGIYVGAPMYNIADENDILYMDPRILLRLQRSNGMAAGNTLNEALVQGISELIERHVSNRVLFKQSTEVHYAINLNNINNAELQEKIKKIQNAGYELYLIDLSYNYNLPVMMSLLLDRKNGIIKTNFGSFPVFDIAAERVITELYQGIESFHESDFLATLQCPYKSVTEGEIRGAYSNSISGLLLSANLIDKLEYVENYNSQVFIDKHNGNDELLNYYKGIARKFNIKFYYLDNSLSKDIAAVHLLICPLDNTFIFESPLEGNNHQKNDIEIQQCLSAIDILKEFYSSLYYNKPINLPKLINLLIEFDSNPALGNVLINTLLWNAVTIVSRDDSSPYLLSLLLDILNTPINAIPFEIVHSELYWPYKKYLQLAVYIQTNAYTKEELFNIFNNIFNYNITEEDIIRCTSPAYLLQKVYIEPFTKYIHSEAFYELISTYTNPN